MGYKQTLEQPLNITDYIIFGYISICRNLNCHFKIFFGEHGDARNFKNNNKIFLFIKARIVIFFNNYLIIYSYDMLTYSEIQKTWQQKKRIPFVKRILTKFYYLCVNCIIRPLSFARATEMIDGEIVMYVWKHCSASCHQWTKYGKIASLMPLL